MRRDLSTRTHLCVVSSSLNCSTFVSDELEDCSTVLDLEQQNETKQNTSAAINARVTYVQIIGSKGHRSGSPDSFGQGCAGRSGRLHNMSVPGRHSSSFTRITTWNVPGRTGPKQLGREVILKTTKSNGTFFFGARRLLFQWRKVLWIIPTPATDSNSLICQNLLQLYLVVINIQTLRARIYSETWKTPDNWRGW